MILRYQSNAALHQTLHRAAPPSRYWDGKLTPTNFLSRRYRFIHSHSETTAPSGGQTQQHRLSLTFCILWIKQTSYCKFLGSLRTRLEKNIRKKKLFIVWQLDYETVWSPVWLQFSSATVLLMSNAADAAFRFTVETQKMLIRLFSCCP